MAYDKTQTIDAFLAAAAARQPAPGGGAVTALAGALACAIGEMVVSYSIGKKDLAAHQDELKQGLSELARARQVMLEMLVEDQAAYESLTAIRKLPDTDPSRASRLDAALLACIRIPQTVGAAALAVLQRCDRLVEKSNKYLLSDLAVCAELAMATVRCAAHNVRVNLCDVQDATDREHFEMTVLKMVADGGPIVRSIDTRIWTRLGNR